MSDQTKPAATEEQIALLREAARGDKGYTTLPVVIARGEALAAVLDDHKRMSGELIRLARNSAVPVAVGKVIDCDMVGSPIVRWNKMAVIGDTLYVNAPPAIPTDDARECRHCGWLCTPNTTPNRKWYPLQEPAMSAAPKGEEG